MERRARTPSLRERKKAQTRERLAEVSLQLFVREGFEAVTVAQIAHAAEVSPATVFNYFATKEDLVFEGLDRFWDGFLAAIAGRPAGGGVVAAAERFIVDQGGPGRFDDLPDQFEAVSAMIAASPALLARERASYDRAAHRLREVIVETSSVRDDADVIAQLILGVHRSLVAFVRERVVAGVEPKELSADVAERTRRGFALLRTGVDA